MTIKIRSLDKGDEDVLCNLASDVFDYELDENLVAEFLADSRHHIVVAIDAGLVVGFASGVHYIHPDKPPELWINEVGVAPTHQRQGIGKKLLQEMFLKAKSLGCNQAWVLTNRSNIPAMGLYASIVESEAPEDVVMFNFSLSNGSNT
ncbi:acetyltransferase [Rivularia sp. PCC 7116]|uniref:GNAT family N-acetyltransferase n=1 Tax=Rivularia sp. PCC 7116 TaxID=373994 RepID=UPI00029EF623|nr:GNAT family N-acetyltransferase [Rivularia sp. PCC 7116]AFY55486.1 acetyltransferase [Rivularia sp. PCC 7116]